MFLYPEFRKRRPTTVIISFPTLTAQSSPFACCCPRDRETSTADSTIEKWHIDAYYSAGETLKGHRARVTCMRLFSLTETSLYRSEIQKEEKVLVTASSDRTIRMWWKGHTHRCFKGHNGPVTSLSERLLGDCGTKLLASGAEDCTVHLWSIASSGKSHPLAATYYGHEKPIFSLSVARHKAYLLVSISKDSKVRVWDTTLSTSSSSSPCVGMASVAGHPVGVRCDEALCYIAAGSSVIAIDLRTMQKVFTSACHLPKIHSFEMLPSKGLICTGGQGKALLWDIRMSQEKPEPVAELDAQIGLVTLLHMDSYKIVTGGPSDHHVHVYETDTGCLANSLDCNVPRETEAISGLSAMAVDGYHIATGGYCELSGVFYYRDYSDCSKPVAPPECDFVLGRYILISNP